MGNRTGTYVAFHAGGTTDPTASDIKFYNIMKAWDANNEIDFSFVNSHDKTCSVRDTSKRATLEARLKARLNMSKNFVLIVTGNTRLDNDWVPLEIRYGVDECRLPIIAAYPSYRAILHPHLLSGYWPHELASRIGNKTTRVIHIPFVRESVLDAIKQWSVHDIKGLSYGSNCYNEDTHRKWGLLYSHQSPDRNYARPPSLSEALAALRLPPRPLDGKR